MKLHFRHLQILRSSIEKTSKGVGADEQRFHDAIMNTIAEFAKNLPNAQKIEILKFILNFDPLPRLVDGRCVIIPLASLLILTDLKRVESKGQED